MFKTPRQNILERKNKLMQDENSLPENSYKKNQMETKIYKIDRKLGNVKFWDSAVKGSYKKKNSEVKNG